LGTTNSETDEDVLIKIGFRKPGEAHAFGGVYYVNEVEETNGATAFKVVATEIPEKDCFYFETYGWQGAKEGTAECVEERTGGGGGDDDEEESTGLSTFSIQFR
jgi:hypothetical protein